jgi:cellulose biosynthesis protein BcsQ
VDARHLSVRVCRAPLSVLSQSSIFGQNLKIGCREFNDLQTPKLSKKQLCDRTRFARQYEHIIIDTQARPTQEDLHALADGCDMLVIPVTPDALSLDALFLILDALEDIGSRRFRVLLTIVPPRPSRDGEEARAKLEEVGVPVLKTSIRRFVAFQKAALQGVPVYQVNDPNAQEGWEEYQQVGRELLYEVTDKSA